MKYSLYKFLSSVRLFILLGMNLSLIQSTLAQSVMPNKASYTVDEDIAVAFTGGLGNNDDWIAIYPQGEVPDGNPGATTWFYTNGTQNKNAGGSVNAGTINFTSPSLPVGDYSAFFLADDGYTLIAGPSNFTVIEAPNTDPPSWITNSFKRRHAVIGSAYTGKISAYTNFTDYTFTKVTGPAWLSVSTTGELSGIPPVGSEGLNLFTLRASNGTNTADASMSIEVFAADTDVMTSVKIMSYNASHGGVGSVAWPTSTAVINAGMSDSFRVVNPDPVALPGNTWSPIHKGTEPQDRIDFLYHKGASVTPTKSIVYTTAIEVTVGAWGNSTAPTVNNTWPSDHAAVITTFRLKPVDLDMDGLSDAFENTYFGDTTTQSGSDDSDQDGFSNESEQALGTNPASAALFPATTMLMPDTPETAPSFVFSLSSLAIDGGLVCERSTDFSSWSTVWSYQDDPKLESALITTNEIEEGKWQVTVKDTSVDTTVVGKVFYRVRLGSP